MKIGCEACGAKYTIADDKVRGRKVKIRCKGCGTPIVVDGQHGGLPSNSDVETDTALEPAEAPVIWSVNLSDTDSRTMSADEIVEGYASGLVTNDAFVWKDGMTDWVPLLESDLAPLLGSAPAPVAAEPAPFAAATAPTATPLPGTRGAVPLFGSPMPAVQVSRTAATTRASQPDNTQDLFGSLDTAGSEEDVATSAPVVPQAGTTAYDDGKMTGARNENSVLFSLDALKAGFSSSPSPNAAKPAPKAPPGKGSGPGAARAQQPSNPDDPFGMGSGNGLMSIGGTSGVLFGADNQALLTAPAPLPPPAPTPAQLAAGAVPAAASRANNKLVYIVGGVGGVVILLLLLLLFSGKKHEDTVPTAENQALPSAATAPIVAAEKPAEAPKPEEPKPSEAPSASAAASASAAPEVKHTDKPVAVAQTGGTPTKKPEPTSAPAADAQPFSKASAISALTSAANSAGSCKKPGGPTGAGKATVTFAPSGRVTTATVAGGSYAGTAVGGCVASVFRRAHVPAFSGSSVTVSKSFQIN
jgi:predicted Zn finger-like uncharacterized protein